ncbi:ADP-ribosylglycohydrolase family protein [Yimella sp. cx-51]|uniref:ADP-ribosylglycohydrolase family protein n=1 Tax=Yimella sp. cx-51 TaxID=2770551 RepID=UPI00165E4F43|nr:ADP-ribosylglycohydrolase family protein [Yimella sp. cx-51]MBC9958377.1 ADP-ribosylglycohydrolase family protein [Yimella sp. cx-51]QTH38218.1 ADP-ribosylglycohydrolase family protein [Yimella sp. cx-51]
MEPKPVQRDRAAGVLLGQAIGDALGVPYEFRSPVREGGAEMIGGGLGPYAPGEWSDDSQMAICIAQASAAGGALSSDSDALNEVARAFIDWKNAGATDIGNQTRDVLGAAEGYAHYGARIGDRSVDEPDFPWAMCCTKEATDYSAGNPRAAGNGALMRNGIVGLTRVHDRRATAAAARAVASLTHADPLAIASCVLHAESVRVAVLEGHLDPRAGLDLLPADEQEQWSQWIDEAENGDPMSFSPNGFTVTAFRAAWSAIISTDTGAPGHPTRALQRAVAIGNDTDTVAAIAGALIGARYGVSGLPWRWRRDVHGWPGLRGTDLISLALQTALAGIGAPVEAGEWPLAERMVVETRRLGVAHPADDRVVLGTEADLAHRDELGCTAVVSLSRVGTAEMQDHHVVQWLVDSDDPETHADLPIALHDAADAVVGLVDEGHRVLLHCVRAEHRTPSVALLYAVKHCGVEPAQAADDIRKALKVNRIGGLLWSTAMEEAMHHAR